VSVYVVRGRGDAAEFLLLRRAKDDGEFGGIWQQVTGGIELGETGWQAACRECREETGIQPERLYSADIFEMFYDWDRDCMVVFPAFLVPVDDDTDVTLSNDHDAYEWAPLQRACELFEFGPQAENARRIHRDFLARPLNEHLRIPLEGRP
jgi:dATP pyrophosphohydrolase